VLDTWMRFFLCPSAPPEMLMLFTASVTSSIAEARWRGIERRQRNGDFGGRWMEGEAQSRGWVLYRVGLRGVEFVPAFFAQYRLQHRLPNQSLQVLPSSSKIITSYRLLQMTYLQCIILFFIFSICFTSFNHYIMTGRIFI
jgi:hypothetical protein